VCGPSHRRSRIEAAAAQPIRLRRDDHGRPRLRPASVVPQNSASLLEEASSVTISITLQRPKAVRIKHFFYYKTFKVCTTL
jgi:hypothetical protein